MLNRNGFIMTNLDYHTLPSKQILDRIKSTTVANISDEDGNLTLTEEHMFAGSDPTNFISVKSIEYKSVSSEHSVALQEIAAYYVKSDKMGVANLGLHIDEYKELLLSSLEEIQVGVSNPTVVTGWNLLGFEHDGFILD